MSIFSSIKNWVAPKQRPVVSKTWRTGMWVMYQDKIAVLAVISELAEIHYTDSIKGENIGIAYVPLASLRQARWPEIPEQRRMISETVGRELGYGP